MKPIIFTKVTKQYIKDKIEKYNHVLDGDSKEKLFNITLDEIRRKKLYLKDMKAVSFSIDRRFIQIGFYSKDRYFSKYIDFY